MKKPTHPQIIKERWHALGMLIVGLIFIFSFWLETHDLPERNKEWQCEVNSRQCPTRVNPTEYGFRRQ